MGVLDGVWLGKAVVGPGVAPGDVLAAAGPGSPAERSDEVPEHPSVRRTRLSAIATRRIY
ncbi:MAG TPA: hypothetical protein VJ625_11855 [Propionibacteriaceae bacterium]|nr:hypothetical protein [Propionibacteriaceae bacterium]